MTRSLASAASIVRLHALYIYGVTHDPSYDSIYVSASYHTYRIVDL